MGKECVEISACASMLLDAYNHIKEYPSSAEDSGSHDRIARHFCQRVINKGCMELEALQAAGVVLGIPSSGASDAIQYYYGWDVVRLARIASKGHTDDIDFRHEDVNDIDAYQNDANDSEADGDNIEPNILHGFPTEASNATGAEHNIDLLNKFHDAEDKDIDGQARVYRTTQGENVPVSDAHHYMHRDQKLWRFNAYEFGRIFHVRKMNKNDEKWYNKAVSQQQHDPTTNENKGGRQCERFLLMAPHPLHTSHILVPRAKIGIPAFAGAPPPSDTSLLLDTAKNAKKKRRFADFYVSNFIPWSSTHPPILSFAIWNEFVRILEEEACLRQKRESNIQHTTSQNEKLAIMSARRSRFIAAGRLYDIENCTDCFRTNKGAVVVLGKHRARARTVWTENGENKPYNGTPSSQKFQAQILLQKLRDKADRMFTQDQASRQNDAQWANLWTKDLHTALCNFQAPIGASATSILTLLSIWRKAASPTKRSLAGGISHPREFDVLLKKPIVLMDAHKWTTSSNTTTAPNTTTYETHADTIDNDIFAEIDDIAYERAVEAHKHHCLPMEEAPLNPEQRASGRDFIKVAILRKERRLQGLSWQDISAEIRLLGWHQVNMMTGTHS